MSKKIYESIDRTFDKDTGEIVHIRSRTTRKTSTEQFIKVYLKDISGYLGLDSITHYKVLAEIWRKADYETNQIILIKSIKEEIAKQINLVIQTVNNAIIQLHKKGLLIRKNKSTYILNPNIFFKGDEIQRANVIQKVFDYKFPENNTEF